MAYVSEHTKFISELKQQNPQMEEGQRQGRALLWDKQIDREAMRRYQQADVPQPGYVYQNRVSPVACAWQPNDDEGKPGPVVPGKAGNLDPAVPGKSGTQDPVVPAKSGT